jgi:hypothetical protein
VDVRFGILLTKWPTQRSPKTGVVRVVITNIMLTRALGDGSISSGGAGHRDYIDQSNSAVTSAARAAMRRILVFSRKIPHLPGRYVLWPRRGKQGKQGKRRHVGGGGLA